MRDFVKFYSEEYDEAGRLQRHGTEFATSTYILDKLINRGSRILDVGAGTGAYSLYYANKGCSVVAIDAVPKYIKVLKEKIQLETGLDIRAYVADIRNPSIPLGTGYDIILFMGPIYHISLLEAKGCIDYCLRLLKRGGIFVVSYVNNHEGHQGSKYSDMFIAYKPVEIEKLLGEYSLRLIFHGPTDGEVFGELNKLSNGLNEEISKFHTWLEKNQFVFEDPRWLRTAIHGLYVGRKTA